MKKILIAVLFGLLASPIFAMNMGGVNVTVQVSSDVAGNAAVSGNVTIGGALTVTGDTTGNLVGNVTGNVTGDITGNVTGTAGTFSSTLGILGQTTIGAAATPSTFTTTGDVYIQRDGYIGRNLGVVGTLIWGAGGTRSTGTAAGLLNTAGTITSANNIVATYGVGAATGAFTGAVDVVGQATFGAAATKSTAAVDGTISAVGFTGPLTGAASSNLLKAGDTMTGKLGLASANKATIIAKDPGAAGEAWYCSDCTTVPVCISTGTAVGDWSLITDKTAACN